MTSEMDQAWFDEMVRLSEEDRQRWEAQQQQRRRVLSRVEAHLKGAFDELHEMGETDYLLSIADWLRERYQPTKRPPRRGHRASRLHTDPEFSRVFWQWLKAPRGKKQAILKREYRRLGYTEWEHLQRLCAKCKEHYPEGSGAFVFGEADAIHNDGR